MVHFKALSTGFVLATLIMALAGCGTGERIQDPAGSKPPVGTTDLTGSSEFDRELIAAKTGNADPIEQVRAMTAVLDKYGVAHPPATELADRSPAVDPAAKPAAQSWNPVRRDMTATNDIRTYKGLATVGNGQFARFAALGNTDNVDPFLVAYYLESGGSSTRYSVRVVGYSDDISSSNRNAEIHWTNNTGLTKTIQIVAFAYATSTRGKGLISITVNGSSTNLFDRDIGGLKRFGATPLPAIPADCNHPSGTTITAWRTFGSTSAAALVIDTKAMRGGYLHTQSGDPEPTLKLPWIVHNPYPSFALLFRPSTWTDPEVPTEYRFLQRENYDCVN